MAIKKRARSDEEKQQREQKIIETAQKLLIEKGYNDINMNEIARASGLAKGTVYLYFNTKEELFLSVLEQQLQGWFDTINDLLDTLQAPADSDVLVRGLVASVANRPRLTRLVALSAVIFEQNISYERARQNKRMLYEMLGHMGARFDRLLGWQPGQGVQFLLRMFVFVAGLEGLAHPSPVSRQVYETEFGGGFVDFERELTDLLSILLQSYQGQR